MGLWANVSSQKRIKFKKVGSFGLATEHQSPVAIHCCSHFDVEGLFG